MNYESTVVHESTRRPGVRLHIRRMSFGRRVELIRRIRELAQKIEYLEAGDNAKESMEAALLASEVERLYLVWGLVKVEELNVDGEPATVELLAESGPDDLCREAVEAIKRECGLTEEERKN